MKSVFLLAIHLNRREKREYAADGSKEEEGPVAMTERLNPKSLTSKEMSGHQQPSTTRNFTWGAYKQNTRE